MEAEVVTVVGAVMVVLVVPAVIMERMELGGFMPMAEEVVMVAPAVWAVPVVLGVMPSPLLIRNQP